MMLGSLYRFSLQRTPWLLLAFSALCLELAALFFQYRQGLQPCVLCVYQRSAVMGLLLAGLIGAVAPRFLLFRAPAMLLWAASSLWGLRLALKHAGMQLFPSPANTCDFAANYPAWAKFDEWIPWLFQPTGFCEDIQWRFLGYTMPQTMLGIYAIYLLVLLIISAALLFGRVEQRSE